MDAGPIGKDNGIALADLGKAVLNQKAFDLQPGKGQICELGVNGKQDVSIWHPVIPVDGKNFPGDVYPSRIGE